ncbi:hypothetical protein ACP26C_13755 [Franconibacter helveticus 513]|uniref:hypothetical protein n=1 Tax=Franconibacter helveticus TaxID=357240 RepID=UPI00040EA709|nr:hypothetical protein [Franconibacter helveticus]
MTITTAYQIGFVLLLLGLLISERLHMRGRRAPFADKTIQRLMRSSERRRAAMKKLRKAGETA